jgi:methylmalonyl-CoA mutase
LTEHKARAAFAANFFEAGGIQPVDSVGCKTVEDAVEHFRQSGAQVAVICSSDAVYEKLIPELVPALEAAGARTVLLAGDPGEHEEAWREAGVVGFIHRGCDHYQLLVDLLQEEGVLHV